MCGIVGGFGSINSKIIEAMVESIRHRGPDHFEHQSINDIHLGHVRLSIIDLTSASNQPLWDANNQACIIFNGEIYNYKILKEELIESGYKFISGGDAEVILNLYLEYGCKFLDKLDGIFSFAIWDTKKEELFIARDHFGVKPLYYTETESGFFFASEIKALMKLPDISKQFNHDAIVRTITFLWSPGRETILKNVFKLEPANYLIIKNQKIIEHKQYWDWPKYCPNNANTTENINQINNALRDSVKDQVISDVKIGSFLSGGLDSSLIVAMAKEIGIKDLPCFTIDSYKSNSNNDGFIDDLPYAKKVAELFNLPLNIVTSNPDIISLLPKMIYHLDEPQADIAPLNVLLICEKAKELGIKVLLSGAGGDDIFTGYRRHKAVKLEKYWLFLPLAIRFKMQNFTRTLSKRNPFFRRIAKAFAYAAKPDNERMLSYFYWIDPLLVKNLFTSEIQTKLQKNPMDFMIKELDEYDSKNKIEKLLYLEKKYFLVDHNFNYTDKMSMAHGVEVRVPFLDKRVADVASRVKTTFKQKNMQSKWILKKVAERYLPKSIIYRPKAGFGAPLRHWLQQDLKPMLEELLSDESIKKRKLFNPQAVKELVSKNTAGSEDYTYPIFALMCIEIWCRLFIDENSMEMQ